MLTQARLKELLHYDTETGLFISVKTTSGRTKEGGPIGWLDDQGYIRLKIDYKLYRAHRLAFLFMEGYSPEHQVDHINGVRDDNRWMNLRHATRSCNMQNQKINIRNTSGFTGVSFMKDCGKWVAKIKINGEDTFIGIHDDKVSAALSRCEYEKCCPDWTCNTQAVNFVKLRGMGYKI